MNFDGPVPGIPGAFIRRVDGLPEALPDGAPAGHQQTALPGELLLVVPTVGRFRSRGGTDIEYTPEPDADSGAVTLMLNGTARGALIHQRGELPLHAATLVRPGSDKAIAICGASGAGKSTTSMELIRRGWQLVADDTTRVTMDGKRAVAWPSRDTIKLWREACEMHGIDIAALTRVTQAMDKYYVQVPARGEAVTLAAVFELDWDDGAPREPASPIERMAVLTRQTFRPHQIRPLGRTNDYVKIVAQIAQSCRIYRLHGARALPVGAFADAIEAFVP